LTAQQVIIFKVLWRRPRP